MADSDSLQKFGLIGGLVFAVVAGGLYFQATREPGAETLRTLEARPSASSAAGAPAERAGSIPVGVLGMMQNPRVAPPEGAAAVERALKAALKPLNRCYDAQQSSHEPDGTLYVKLHTTADGSARDVQLAFRGPSGEALHNCASAALAAVRYEDVAADTLVSWPLRWARGKGLTLR